MLEKYPTRCHYPAAHVAVGPKLADRPTPLTPQSPGGRSPSCGATEHEGFSPILDTSLRISASRQSASQQIGTLVHAVDDACDTKSVELLSVRPDMDLRDALASAGLLLDRPVLVCVGGAGGMAPDIERAVDDLLRRHLVPALERWGAVVVDGGTDSGLMRSLGTARAKAGASFQLIGVVARGTVAGLGDAWGNSDTAELEPNHTHVVLVPGDDWGDESPWISAVADAIAGAARSATLLVNGGAISLNDADLSLAEGRPLLVLAGSGRAADDIAQSTQINDRIGRIADHEQTRVAPILDGSAVVRSLAAILHT